MRKRLYGKQSCGGAQPADSAGSTGDSTDGGGSHPAIAEHAEEQSASAHLAKRLKTNSTSNLATLSRNGQHLPGAIVMNIETCQLILNRALSEAGSTDTTLYQEINALLSMLPDMKSRPN